MKTFLVILDGAGDRACKELGNKTPLKAANTPNLDFFSSNGKLGYMYSIKENIPPESDNALTSILGNDLFVAARGQLEAMGAGINLERGDLALRTNFATITNIKEGKILDRRAGRTLSTKEAEILGKEINKKVKLPCKFIFKPTVQHRGVLILKGGFSDNITNTDPSYMMRGKFSFHEEFKYSEPLDEEDSSKISANILNSFTEQSYLILNNHPINQYRIKNKFLPANMILARDPGIEIPKLNKLTGNWAGIVYMPLEIGIAKSTGMKVFSFSCPSLKDADIYKNLFLCLGSYINLSKSIITRILNKYDYFYLHFKETDIPGHDNKPLEKRK
jgi:2,3-bisphosphoglycerate-independent phosphoglycerate mutase